MLHGLVQIPVFQQEEAKFLNVDDFAPSQLCGKINNNSRYENESEVDGSRDREGGKDKG